MRPFRDAYQGRSAFASESRPPVTTRFVPFVRSLSGYSGTRFRTDAIAGITVAALALPSAMAYAELAGAPVSADLYSLLLPVQDTSVTAIEPGYGPAIFIVPRKSVLPMRLSSLGCSDACPV